GGRHRGKPRRRTGAGPLPAALVLAHAAPCARVRGGARRGGRGRRDRHLPRSRGAGRRRDGEARSRRHRRRSPGDKSGLDADGRGGGPLRRRAGEERRPGAHARRRRCRPGRRAHPRGAWVNIETAVPLGRYTTLGAGGPALAFAKPTTLEEVEEALAWAREHELPVAVVGLGSNLLVADEGVDTLALKLEGELASAEVRGDLLVAGGGAANAVCLHRVRAAGLGGFEFACA